jgi:glycosyltransferase involved in cell wall biosynthesis
MVAAVARPALRAMRHRPRLVYTEHNSWDCYGRATRWANAVTYRLDDAQISVSNDAVESVPGALSHDLEVLTHGIDLEAVRAHASDRDALRRELRVDDATVVVTTIANFRTEKAYDVLLAAAAETVAAHDDVVFVSVGHGPLREEMTARHAELGLGDRFRFLGFRSDALGILAASDMFTLSSRNEGLPVSLMEATALGLPTVATRVGGLADFVIDGTTGLLVPPESPSLLAAAYSVLIDDPEARRTMGRHAASAAAQFDATVAVRRLEAIYADARRPPTGGHR